MRRFILPVSGWLVVALLFNVPPLQAGLFSRKKTAETTNNVPTPPAPTNVPPPVVAVPPPPAPKPVIVWDAQVKEVDTKLGDSTANVFFMLTNISPVEAVVTAVRPSCGCTTAHLPPMPWTNAPGVSGRIDLSINLAGKSGTLFKTVTVDSTAGSAVLQIKLVMPDLAAARAQNMQLAMTNRQAVFKGNCANCHVDPGQGKMGAELYAAVCGVCHEAEHRATMVADLHHLNHPTNLEHWRTWISSGKPDSLMPAFSQAQGGPLTDEQINSLADYLVTAIPSAVSNQPAK